MLADSAVLVRMCLPDQSRDAGRWRGWGHGAAQEELDAFIKSADSTGAGQIRYQELCARFGDLNVVDDKG